MVSVRGKDLKSEGQVKINRWEIEKVIDRIWKAGLALLAILILMMVLLSYLLVALFFFGMANVILGGVLVDVVRGIFGF